MVSKMLPSKLLNKISVTELVALCVRNHTAAWDEFLQRFHRRVLLCALRQAHKSNLNENDVAEIVQEVFLSLLSNDYRTLRDFRGTTELELIAYLSKITHNITLNLLRREERQTQFGKVVSLDSPLKVNDGVSFAQLLEAGNESCPDHSLEDKQSPQQVQELLKSVLTGTNAPRDAIIFYLYAVAGLSAREISQIHTFSLSFANVQTIISRTKEKLRGILSKEFFRNL
ncbi:MAG: hypothetical protein FD167_3412 [bacterium]|nr:MAG: hypothetical protein FD167_3412 [bacterium]